MFGQHLHGVTVEHAGSRETFTGPTISSSAVYAS
jgi:hypothetical protein